MLMHALFDKFSNYLYHYISDGLVIIFTICGLRCVDIGLGLADWGLRTSRPAYDIDL